MPSKRNLDIFRPAASNYVLFEDAERYVQEPTIRDDRPKGLKDPNAVYLVYLHLDPTGQLIIKQLESDLDDSKNLEDVERALFKMAADPKLTPKSTNFEMMVWSRPTYLTFVIHNPGWQFYWRDDDRRHNPMRFFRRKDKIPPSTDLYQENHSFFEAERFLLDDKNGGKHGAFRCVNFVRDENGPLTIGQKRRYCFQIYLEAPFSLKGSAKDSERSITVLIDPDGQNQGPPKTRYRKPYRRSLGDA